MRYFSRRYRCVAYNARGYPPSDVPAEVAKYSQARACDDIRAVLDGLRIDKAHVVGISMGGFAALHFGMRYGDRARSLVIGGCGYGAEKGSRARFQQEAEHAAEMFDRIGMADGAKRYALGKTRVQLQNKDSRGWQEFAAQMAEHSALGSANTLRGVQKQRPSLFDLVDEMKKMTVPTLGDDRRRGRPLYRGLGADEANDRDRGARGAAQDRPRAQPGGAGAVERAGRRIFPPGRGRPLDHA
jgi:pimeloyl-ACP methyl ester carboxylesterase